ncbi:hypothetical protein H5410_032604 [Solanum commersonii]|uniref:Transmembrane protein n=1 Tax=Solanum commersonii TaxID=4109 RepID=A0A9J5YLE7_SOLCO|nr:hypothetical protein H5410_032604 [Solanum commersonii]
MCVEGSKKDNEAQDVDIERGGTSRGVATFTKKDLNTNSSHGNWAEVLANLYSGVYYYLFLKRTSWTAVLFLVFVAIVGVVFCFCLTRCWALINVEINVVGFLLRIEKWTGRVRGMGWTGKFGWCMYILYCIVNGLGIEGKLEWVVWAADRLVKRPKFGLWMGLN